LLRCTERSNTDPNRMKFSHRQFENAGFLRRALAFIMDTSIISLISTVLAFSLFGREYLLISQQGTLSSLLDWRILTFEHALPALWVVGFWLLWMATPGKLLFDCRVVDARSKTRATIAQLVIRYLAYMLSALPLGLGFIWIIFDKHNQGWHDKLARTRVIMQDESLQPIEAYQ
jgi:uncharacterized RDD family membrane protein YckC